MAKKLKLGEDLKNAILDAVKSELLDIYFPIGKLYITVGTEDPNQTIGGTWIKIGTGKTLWGSDSDANLGTEVAAGLPNITGNITGATWNTSYGLYNFTVNGAFVKYNTYPQGRITAEDSYWSSGTTTSGWFGIDASKSNAIYGKSSTVQPPAIKCYFWKRTA